VLLLVMMVLLVAVALSGSSFAQEPRLGPGFPACEGLGEALDQQKAHRPMGPNEEVKHDVAERLECLVL
jgi:hypothetical protein